MIPSTATEIFGNQYLIPNKKNVSYIQIENYIVSADNGAEKIINIVDEIDYITFYNFLEKQNICTNSLDIIYDNFGIINLENKENILIREYSHIEEYYYHIYNTKIIEDNKFWKILLWESTYM